MFSGDVRCITMFPRYVDFTVTNDWRCSRKLTSFSVPLQASVSMVRVIGSLVPNDLETKKNCLPFLHKAT